jgi:hypothetical protein
MANKIMYAVTTAMVNGILVREGMHWPANDPLVLAHPGLFSDDPRVGMQTSAPLVDDDVVEQATAAPGERRTQVRRG